MDAFGCPRCGLSFGMKHHLKRHLERTNACEPLKSNISLEDAFKAIFARKHGKYECKHCNKNFVHGPNMYRHQKTCIKNDDNIRSLMKEMKQQVIEMREQVETIKHQPRSRPTDAELDATIMENNGYVYVLIEREFIRMKESVIKFGCTQDVLKRFRPKRQQACIFPSC